MICLYLQDSSQLSNHVVTRLWLGSHFGMEQILRDEELPSSFVEEDEGMQSSNPCQMSNRGHCQHPYSLVATLIISRAVLLSTNQATDFDQKYITIPVLLQFSLIPMNLESYKYVHI
jgi:hypothetical protein